MVDLDGIEELRAEASRICVFAEEAGGRELRGYTDEVRGMV